MYSPRARGTDGSPLRARPCRTVAWPRSASAAAADSRAAAVAGLAGNAAQVFPLVVVRFQLLVGDAPVLDRHVVRDRLLAVALFVVGAQQEIGRQESPVLPVPVHAGAAHARGRQERTELTHRQGELVGPIAERQRD